MPHDMADYAEQAAGNGISVVIAGAGGAAHLPGMVASMTDLPVIGVPVPLAHLDGLDSLLSIVQMPAGIPVATVGIGNARNAGLLAARIIGAHDADVRARLTAFRVELRQSAIDKGEALRATLRAAGTSEA
jgi:5-(carboxyamino)imidazole ribonucleotide mutase